MESSTDLRSTTSSDCECCQLSADMTEAFGCSERAKIFTLREQEILNNIRQLGQKARELKEQIQQSAGDASLDPLAVRKLRADLENLRQVREDLEKQRVAAADERMRLLGHIE